MTTRYYDNQIFENVADMEPNVIKTTEKYWDCECKANFIRPKTQTKCNICGAVAEEQPDSMVNEVLDQGFLL